MRRALFALLAACADEPSGGGPDVNSFVETYFIPAANPHPLDILVVVDDTTAMAPYQSGLATFAADLAAFANGEYLPDLRIAATTTSGTGTLRDPSTTDEPYLALAYDDRYERQPNFTGSLSDAITQLVTAGAGASTVQPLESMKAIDAFVRTDIHALAVVTIAASDDASSGTITDYASDLKASKSDPTGVYVAGIYPAGATRLSSFHGMFPNRATSADIATTNFTGTLGSITHFIRTVLGFPCFPEPLDLAPDIAGPQYDCDLHATFDDGTEIAIRHCSVTDGPCFEFELDPTSCGGPGLAKAEIRGFPTPYHPSIEGQCVVSAEN